MELGLYNQNSELVPFVVDKRNTLVIGTDNSNNTDLLIRLALDDIYDGLPVVFIDPTGNATDKILKYVPKQRQSDVILFDPARQPFAFNILANIKDDKRDIFAATVLETVKGIWGYENAPTPVLDKYFRGALLTALAAQGQTFFSLKFLLTDKHYRTSVLSGINDTVLKIFWHEYETLTPKEQRQDIDSTVNKLWAFLFSPIVRDCLDQRHNAMTFKDKIVLVSLRTREIGTDNASLLGALVLACLYVEDVEQNLYINGSRFGTAILGSLLSTCPSVTTVLAIQFLDQIRPEFQPFLLGGIEQIVAFRTSYKDSLTLSPDFHLNRNHYSLADMNALGERTSYACINGTTTVLQPIDRDYQDTHQVQKIIDRCRSQYTAPLEAIQNRIDRFIPQPPKRRRKTNS